MALLCQLRANRVCNSGWVAFGGYMFYRLKPSGLDGGSFKHFIYKVSKERALRIGRRNRITSQASVLASTESLGKHEQKMGIICWLQGSAKISAFL